MIIIFEGFMQLNNMNSVLFFPWCMTCDFFFISACSLCTATSVQIVIDFHSQTCLKDHPSCSLCLSARLYSLLLLAISPWVPGHGTKQHIALKQRRATGVLNKERGGAPSNGIGGKMKCERANVSNGNGLCRGFIFV